MTEAVSTLEFFVSPFFLGSTSTDDEDLGALSNCFNALMDSSLGTTSDDDDEDRGALSNCFNALTDSSFVLEVTNGFTNEGSLATMEIFVVEPRILFNAFMETDSWFSVYFSEGGVFITSTVLRHGELSFSSLSVSETTETVSEVWSDPDL